MRRALPALAASLLLATACSAASTPVASAAARKTTKRTVKSVPKAVAGTLKPAPVPTAGQTASIAIDCAGDRKPINPLIYGIAFNVLGEQRDQQQFTIGASARRWGGNPTSRYNFEIDAWNTAQDYFWRNVSLLDGGSTWQKFLEANRTRGMQSALTVPTLGWVAKDTSTYSFPVSQVGPQQFTDPDIPDAGNGSRPDGKKITPPSPERTSLAASPAWVAKWLTAVKAATPAGKRALDQVILDNEPDLWNETHRDVHPQPASYDEILKRTIDYGTAVREVMPDAQIAGPASWGWWAYFYSAKDNANGGFSAKVDRRAHGDVPFLEWYLQQVRAHEKQTGTRLLDVLDVHFYPQGQGIYDGGSKDVDPKDVDPKVAALRIRSTRALWDPTYRDESWIGEPVRLLPRLKEIVANNAPGLGISIGEYNFYGENHISGAIAQAEALGRFGQAGITSAFLWTYPADRSPQYWGFRTFRNFDGQGGRFLDQSISARSSDAEVTAFASTDAFSRQVVAVVINQSPTKQAVAGVSTRSCNPLTRVQQWSYRGGADGFTTTAPVALAAGATTVTLAPWSVNVLRFDPA